MNVGLGFQDITSPKLKPGAEAEWYEYYAGYAAGFVRDVLGVLAPPEQGPKRVLDPWNGSGTTTAVATAAGHHAVGVDKNPALVTIAKGRHLVHASVAESIDALRAEIVSAAKHAQSPHELCVDEEDALLEWLKPATAARVRALELAAYRILVERRDRENPVDPAVLSPLAAFFYCGLFTLVRQLTAPFRSSNPTWVRSPRDERDRVSAAWRTVEAKFRDGIQRLAARLVLPANVDHAFDLFEGSAEQLNIDPVDVVLTSPPYCTRIDYVVATRPELALLGYASDAIAAMRKKMLGSPLTEPEDIRVESSWGPTASCFLRAVRAHDSKAAATYYYRYYSRYMRDLSQSLNSINSVTRTDGVIACVVQDSQFKDVHLDLPRIVCEMGASVGRAAARVDFIVPRTKAAIHPGARSYRSTFGAVESVVVLTRERP